MSSILKNCRIDAEIRDHRIRVMSGHHHHDSGSITVGSFKMARSIVQMVRRLSSSIRRYHHSRFHTAVFTTIKIRGHKIIIIEGPKCSTVIVSRLILLSEYILIEVYTSCMTDGYIIIFEKRWRMSGGGGGSEGNEGQKRCDCIATGGHD